MNYFCIFAAHLSEIGILRCWAMKILLELNNTLF